MPRAVLFEEFFGNFGRTRSGQGINNAKAPPACCGDAPTKLPASSLGKASRSPASPARVGLLNDSCWLFLAQIAMATWRVGGGWWLRCAPHRSLPVDLIQVVWLRLGGRYRRRCCHQRRHPSRRGHSTPPQGEDCCDGSRTPQGEEPSTLCCSPSHLHPEEVTQSPSRRMLQHPATPHLHAFFLPYQC